MKAFRFRLARLLEIREREEDERRAALEIAREAVRRSEAEIERLARERARTIEEIPLLTAIDAWGRRRDLILYEEFLRNRLEWERQTLLEHAEREALALESFRTAVRDRRILTRLRDRKRVEFLHELERQDQFANDELAQRAWRLATKPGGSLFPSRGKKLPVSGLSKNPSKHV